MKKNWVLLSAIAVFLFTITGLGYVTYRNQHLKYDNGSSVLGAIANSITVKLTIEYDGRRDSYETSELKPGNTLLDLINSYNGERDNQVQIKTRGTTNYIDSIDSYYSDESNSWTVYVDNVEYIGLFDNLPLADGNQIRIIWE